MEDKFQQLLQQIVDYYRERGYSLRKLAEEVIGVNEDTLYSWRAGLKQPTSKSMMKLYEVAQEIDAEI